MTNLRSLLLKLHHADEQPGTLLEAEGDQAVEEGRKPECLADPCDGIAAGP